jgi:hypothetical protein
MSDTTLSIRNNQPVFRLLIKGKVCPHLMAYVSTCRNQTLCLRRRRHHLIRHRFEEDARIYLLQCIKKKNGGNYIN